MDIIASNKYKFIASSALRLTATLFASGAVLQTFLASLGFSSRLIYINATIIQFVNLLATSALSRSADNKDIIKHSARVQIPAAVMFLCFLPLCIWNNASTTTYLYLTLVCVLHTVFNSLYVVCEYKLPYFTMPPESYAQSIAVSGIVYSVFSTLSGVIISSLSSRYSYSTLMLFFFTGAALMTFFAVLIIGSMKPMPGAPESKTETVTKGKKEPALKILMRTPIFTTLISANYLRGFGWGVVSVIATVALDMDYGEATATAVVAVSSVAFLVSSALFGALLHKLPAQFWPLLGCLSFLAMGLMYTGDSLVFLIGLFIVVVGRTFLDNAMPYIMRAAVPSEISGPYNAWRMILHFTGVLTATSIATVISPELLLAITIVSQIVCGLQFYTSKLLRIKTA